MNSFTTLFTESILPYSYRLTFVFSLLLYTSLWHFSFILSNQTQEIPHQLLFWGFNLVSCYYRSRNWYLQSIWFHVLLHPKHWESWGGRTMPEGHSDLLDYRSARRKARNTIPVPCFSGMHLSFLDLYHACSHG